MSPTPSRANPTTLRIVALATGLLASVAGAPAQADDREPFPSDFLKGVYSSEPACASGVDRFRDDAVMYLDADGLTAIEYFCEFLTFHDVPDVRAFIAVTACSAPGELTPELVMVRDVVNGGSTEDTPAETVGVVFQGTPEETVFHRCAGE